MTVNEYISEIERYLNVIEENEKEVMCYRKMLSVSGTGDSNGVPNSTRVIEAPFVNYVHKIVDLEKEVESEKEHLSELRKDFSFEIEKLSDPEEKLVMFCRYIAGNTMPKVAENMSCSIRKVQYVHKRAIFNLEKICTPFSC